MGDRSDDDRDRSDDDRDMRDRSDDDRDMRDDERDREGRDSNDGRSESDGERRGGGDWDDMGGDGGSIVMTMNDDGIFIEMRDSATKLAATAVTAAVAASLY